jgi:hypothetical protein
MKSTKCPQCGLVYWATDPKCKRCGLATADPNFVNAQEPQQEFQPRPDMQPMQFMNSADDPVRAKLLKDLKTDSIFFYVIGGLQILLWLVIGHLMIIDGFLNIGLSFIAYKFRSRVAAICVFGLQILSLMVVVAEFAGGERPGVVFPIGMILRLLCSGRMVQATFKLSGYAAEGPATVLPPPPPNFHPDGTPQWTGTAASPQWQASE